MATSSLGYDPHRYLMERDMYKGRLDPRDMMLGSRPEPISPKQEDKPNKLLLLEEV